MDFEAIEFDFEVEKCAFGEPFEFDKIYPK